MKNKIISFCLGIGIYFGCVIVLNYIPNLNYIIIGGLIGSLWPNTFQAILDKRN